MTGTDTEFLPPASRGAAVAPARAPAPRPCGVEHWSGCPALAATVSAWLLALNIYEWGLFDLIAGGRASWVLLTRNLILVGLFGWLLVELAERRSVRESP
jgi:hypothetical protein